MIFYAVIIMLITEAGDQQFIMHPVANLQHCRAMATVIRLRQDERIADAQCAALVLDKPERYE